MDLYGCSLLAIEGPSAAESQLEPASPIKVDRWHFGCGG